MIQKSERKVDDDLICYLDLHDKLKGKRKQMVKAVTFVS